MSLFKKKTIGYVSEIDNFLKEFDRTHALSESQQAEILKYDRIYRLRDVPQEKTKEGEIWEEF